MAIFQISSIQQRLFFFLLIPVIILLLGAGFLTFIYARNIMVEQWEEAAILKLQRVAHDIDMKLNQPIQLVEILNGSGGLNNDAEHQKLLFDQLENLEGVTHAKLTWLQQQPENTRHSPSRGGYRMRRFHHGIISNISKPTYNSEADAETVSLISKFFDETDNVVGKLEVTIRFEYLMEDVFSLGWWQSNMASLIDNTGQFVTKTATMAKQQNKLGENGSPLELSVLDAIEEKKFGTVRGPGHPPTLVAGFYGLEKAPWSILLVAQGDEILKPIIRFRTYFFYGSIVLTLLILGLIRFNVGGMVASIRELSTKARSVAEGHYGQPIIKKTEDEIGQLIDSYNMMVEGLKERDFIRNTFGRYVDKEFAQELLKNPEIADSGGQMREGVILMSDLRGFTPLAEAYKPEVIIRLLNHFFSYMIHVIKRHRGIVVDLIGDAVLVFFDPLDGPIRPSAISAVNCAREMQNEMIKFNHEIEQEEIPKIYMGVGIHAGNVVVGNIGSKTRTKYSIIGSAVNITHRIQSVAKPGEILISESVYGYVKEKVSNKPIKSPLKGVKEMMKLYEI